LAFSTIVEYSQQEDLQIGVVSGMSSPQLLGPVIRTYQLPSPGVLMSETTRANLSSGRWKYGREICREFCR